MANQRQQPDPSGFTAEDEIDLVLGHANPNPTRDGCPPQEVLLALARRERPIDDPAYNHLIKCSPCYREVRALQQSAGVQPRATPRSPRWWRAAAAAVLILGVAGAWFLLSRPDRSLPAAGSPEVSKPVEVGAQVDLRKYTVARSDEKQAEPGPVSLPRARVKLTLLLPVGSDPGRYEVQVLDSNLVSKVSAVGEAEIRNYITTLEATLDIGVLPPGAYQLALRRHGEDWRLFPARVR
jgi:hypothetical protein